MRKYQERVYAKGLLEISPHQDDVQITITIREVLLSSEKARCIADASPPLDS